MLVLTDKPATHMGGRSCIPCYLDAQISVQPTVYSPRYFNGVLNRTSVFN